MHSCSFKSFFIRGGPARYQLPPPLYEFPWCICLAYQILVASTAWIPFTSPDRSLPYDAPHLQPLQQIKLCISIYTNVYINKHLEIILHATRNKTHTYIYINI